MKKIISTFLFVLLFVFLEASLLAQNPVISEDFETEDHSFVPFAADWLGVSSDFSVIDGELALTNISQGSTDAWHLQAYSHPISLENGKTYKVSFDAHADAERPCHLFVGEEGGDYTPYLETNISIGTELANFEFIFTMTEPTDNSAKIAFELGLSDVSTYFDNVLIKEEISSGIEKVSLIDDGLKVYPNPAIDLVYLESDDLPGTKISIYNMVGQLVDEEIAESSVVIFNTATR